MTINFDILNRYKFPQIKLCKPGRVAQYFISNYRNLKITPNFNAVSEVSFNVDRYINNINETSPALNPAYNSILSDKLLFLGNEFGWFIITEATIQNDGLMEYKQIKANSYEYILSRSDFYGLTDTVKFYNPLNATDETTIIGLFLKDNPSWSVGTITSSLWNEYRTFDISSSTWYDFLMNNIEETYECIFTFDTINLLINAYTPEESLNDTNIYVSYENLVESLSVEEKSDEIYSAMDCYGGEELTVTDVNPMGTSTIYNFTWLLANHDEWMSDGLWTALTSWQQKYNTQKTSYENIMLLYKNTTDSYVTAEITLTELNTILKSKQQALALYIGTDNLSDTRYSELVSEVSSAQSAVSAKEGEITTLETTLTTLYSQLQAIVNNLAFNNTENFSTSQYRELISIIKKTSYQNDTFTINSLDSNSTILEEKQKLYDHCVNTLARISVPRWVINCDITNFAFLPNFIQFTSQFSIGSQIIIEIRKGWTEKAVCLSYTLDYDNPSSMNIELSNRYRADGSIDEYSELLNRAVTSSGTFTWLKGTILDSERTGLNSEARQFINSNFDASKNEIDTATGVQMNISGSGIQVQRYNTDSTLSGLELRILNSGVFLSDDNFTTAPRTAIGRFKLPNSSNYAFGVNAELLASNLVITEQLQILSGNNLFRLDADGLYAYNANIIAEANNSKVVIDPMDTESVFKLYGALSGSTRELNLWIDSSGNLNTKGTIYATDLYIGGAHALTTNDKISSNFLELKGISITDTSGNNSFSVDTNGYVTIGSSSSTTVTINAPLISNSSISAASLSGSTITSSTLTVEEGNISVRLDPNSSYPFVILNSNDTLFYVDTSGNLVTKGSIYAESLYLGSSDINALDSYNKITGDFLNLKGISITDTSGYNTFAVGTDGYVTIGSEQNTASLAIFSPTIVGGSFEVSGTTSKVKVSDGTITISKFLGFQPVVGTIAYDSTGAGTTEDATQRMFIKSYLGYPLKIYSEDNISIQSASGTIYGMGTWYFPASNTTISSNSISIGAFGGTGINVEIWGTLTVNGTVIG